MPRCWRKRRLPEISRPLPNCAALAHHLTRTVRATAYSANGRTVSRGRIDSSPGPLDLTTPTALAKQYLDAIKAPHKEFVQIDGGHFAVFMNSDQFLRELVAHVLPLASGR